MKDIQRSMILSMIGRYIICEYEYDDLNWDDPIIISVSVNESNQILNMICIVNQK